MTFDERIRKAINETKTECHYNPKAFIQMVDEYGCGFSFEADDELDLASKLRAVIQNKNKYLEYVRQAQCAAKLISPERKTKEFIETVNARFNRWFE